MKRMYAPWRYTWIQESKDGVEECFLCDALEAPVERDRELLLLHRGGQGFIILNRYPYSNGHLMVAPNRHVSDLRELTEEEWREIGELTNLSLAILEKAIQPHGFNLGWNLGRVAGAGLEEHLHLHVVPRWEGDTNFMPVVGESKVISQDLWESYDQLHLACKQLISG